MNKLALGTVQFGLNYGVANTDGQVSARQAKYIVDRALKAGMDTLDTAIVYGNSEEELGKIGIESWRVVTKLPEVPVDCKDVSSWVTDQVECSLERLGLSEVYGLLLHQPEQLLGDEGVSLYRCLCELKENGKVRKIGLSIYDPQELEAIISSSPIDIIQAPFSVLDRRLIESGWADRLRRMGVEIHARSIFLQGLLLMTKEQRPSKFNRWAETWSEWHQWLNQTGLTPLQACLRFSLSQELIDRVVIGVDSVAQLKEILSCADGLLCDSPNFPALQDTRLINPATWDQL